EAPSLDEYLGEVGRMSLNMLALHGDNRIAKGIHKYTIPCNWKFATDNVWDFYHGITTHASAYISTMPQTAQIRNNKARYEARNLAFLGDYGHVMSGPAVTPAAAAESDRDAVIGRGIANEWRDKPETQKELG